jgi:hypothetical protein
VSRVLRWSAQSTPYEGMVLDNFPNGEGYSVVEAVEPDPDATWELSAHDDPPEYRPTTHYVRLRPATEEEAEGAKRRGQRREAHMFHRGPLKPTLLKTLRHWRERDHWPKWRPWMSPDDTDYVCERCGGHPW